MTVDRLSPLDATFLHVEDDVSHMHIGSVGIFEGPVPDRQALHDAITAKLALLPRLRQTVRFLPLAAGRPVWVDDPHFALDYHLRRTALPAPGGQPELLRLVGRLMSTQLDRARPLWEMWVVEGLEHTRWALITKLHHCMVDGVSGSALITELMDTTEEPPRSPVAAWAPRPQPGDLAAVAGALAERARWPVRVLRSGVAAARDPRWFLEHTVATVQGLAAYTGLASPPPDTGLNGPVGPHRRWAVARTTLADVGRIRREFGGTVNDVVLTAISGGFRALLAGRGEPVDRTLRTLVPVSVRARGEHGTYDNRVSAIFADLPVGIEDPVQRLRQVSGEMRHLKDSHEAVAGEVLTSVGGFVPEVLLSLGGRLATRAPQRAVNTVTTNVPGPQQPLYLGGRRMVEAFPFVPLGGHVRVGVAIYSYDGALGFGVTGDYDTAPDIGTLCTGIEREMQRLLVACGPPAEVASPAH